MLLLFGEQSRQANPYLRYRQPELAWRRAFTDYRVDVIAGCHGELFDRDASLDSLSGRLRHHLERETHLDAGQMPWWRNDLPVVRHEVRPVTAGLRFALALFVRERRYDASEDSGQVYRRLGRHYGHLVGEAVPGFPGGASSPAQTPLSTPRSSSNGP